MERRKNKKKNIGKRDEGREGGIMEGVTIGFSRDTVHF